MLNQFFLKLILLFNPKERQLSPIINKNMESHGLKNMKANLMFSIIITFGLFTQCNFKQNFTYLMQMGSLLFGSDMSLCSVAFTGSFIPIDEGPIREILEP